MWSSLKLQNVSAPSSCGEVTPVFGLLRDEWLDLGSWLPQIRARVSHYAYQRSCASLIYCQQGDALPGAVLSAPRDLQVRPDCCKFIVRTRRDRSCLSEQHMFSRSLIDPTRSVTVKSRDVNTGLCSCVPDELAKFLLYVKTLGYQDKPDYQRLKAVLASSATGRLDFSVTREPAAEPKTKTLKTPARDKVRTRHRLRAAEKHKRRNLVSFVNDEVVVISIKTD